MSKDCEAYKKSLEAVKASWKKNGHYLEVTKCGPLPNRFLKCESVTPKSYIENKPTIRKDCTLDEHGLRCR